MVMSKPERYDFIGLSTDTKPTPETSERVVNGSTYYTADDSKLYVFCNGEWYERQPLGGGGGGASYTAGDGIDITDAVISATNTGKPKALTAADYNANSNNWSDTDPANFNCVALWKLEPGVYSFSDTSVSVQISSSYISSLFFDQRFSGLFIIVPYSTGYVEVVFITSIGGNGTYGTGPARSLLVKSSDGSLPFAVQFPVWLSTESIRDDLTTDNAVFPLSAKQGKVLNDKITALEARVAALEGN